MSGMTWEQELVRENFLDVAERLELTPQQAIDCEFEAEDLEQPARDDLFFGIGYVRGLADAWDMTALQVCDEVLARMENEK